VKNRGGIVVQDESGNAHLDLHNCRVHANGGMGLVMYGGSGYILDNRVQENAMGSIAIHPNSSFINTNGAREPLNCREIHMARNTLCIGADANGTRRPPILVSVLCSVKTKMLKLITFNDNFSNHSSHAVFFVMENNLTNDFCSAINRKMFASYEHFFVDICTGLVLDQTHKCSPAKILTNMNDRASSIARMYSLPSETLDFSLHFNKESLVSAFERAEDYTTYFYWHKQNEGMICIPFSTPGPSPTNTATGSSVSSLREC